MNMSSTPYPTENHEALTVALGIMPEEKVLDIGGGHKPFARADVVVDIDFHSGCHRDGSHMFIDTSRHHYVQTDITALPFPDKSFDFVTCIHVLEHIDNPTRACEELMRVARRGFLETPRKWTEFYAGYPTHRWLVDDNNGILTFEPITFNTSPFLNFALPPVWSSPDLLRRVTVDYHDIPCVQLAWRNRFNYQVKGQLTDISLYKNPAATADKHYSFARNLLYWMAPPDHGLYHAARAAELSSYNPIYSKLYAFYLALSGKWSLARQHGLTPKLALYAAISNLILRVSRWITIWYRRIIALFPVR